MFRVYASSLIIAALLLGCATQPGSQAAAGTEGNKQMAVIRGTQPEDQNKLCSQSYPLGSHIPEQVCLTKAQQEAVRKKSQEMVRDFQNSPAPGNNCSGPAC